MTESLADLRALAQPRKPNRWLIAPEGVLQNARPDAPSPVLPSVPERVFSVLETIVSADPKVSGLIADRAAKRMSYVARVPFLGFKDDVDIEVLEEAGGSALILYSRSRVGYGDFGVNRRRAEELLRRLGEELTS